MIRWMKYKKIYFSFSGILIIISIWSLLTSGLRLSVDFKGGTLAEYKFDHEINTVELEDRLQKDGLEISSVQKTGENTYLFRLATAMDNSKDSIKDKIDKETEGGITELRFETVGPTIGPELIKKTIYAISISSIAILLWIAYQFKNLKYGISAVLAMFHDTFILVGAFSLLGKFFGVEVDFLFVTALLTTLSFSVHDTIVVYDRIREIHHKFGGEIEDLADIAVTETMVRSLNNSFTIIFMLTALSLLGGITVRWFAVALLIGTVMGTYSSPFVAVPILITLNKLNIKKR